MPKVLFVTSSLDYCSSAKQLTLLAGGLSPDDFQVRVCILGSEGPFTRALDAAGVEWDCLGRSRLFDPQPFWHLRRLLRTFGPDLVHAWNWPALRAVGLLTGGKWDKNRRTPQIVLSPGCTRKKRGFRLSWWDRILLKRSARVALCRQADADFYERLPLAREKIHLVPAGVEIKSPSPEPGKAAAGWPEGDSLLPSLKLPRGARFLACVGPLEPHKGFRDAIWAFDILRHVYPDLHLVIVGGGSDRDRLQEFARALRTMDRVHFLGYQADVAPLLAQSLAVLVPGEIEGGMNVALESMAVGRPVVACRSAGVEDMVLHGETGFLVPGKDQAALARKVRALLDSPELGHRMGQAGRKLVEGRFAVSKLVRGFVRLYESVMG